MRIKIRVIPRSSKNEVVETMSDGIMKVKLTAPPIDGKANESLIEVLSDHFGIAKSLIRIVKGEKGRMKEVEIES